MRIFFVFRTLRGLELAVCVFSRASTSQCVLYEICTEYGTCAFEEFAFCAQHEDFLLHIGDDDILFVHGSLKLHSFALCKRLVCGPAGQAQGDRMHLDTVSSRLAHTVYTSNMNSTKITILSMMIYF